MEKTWRTVIGDKPKLWDIDFREVWQFRSLITMLFKRNYSIQYKQTILGPLWMILSVIFNSGVLTLVFGYVGKISSDGIPYFLFCLSGNVIWGLFSSCLSGNTRVLADNAYIFGKVYFPRVVVPLSNILLSMTKCFLQMIVCFAVLIVFILQGEVNFTGLKMLGIIPMFLLAAIMGTSLGIIISSMTVKYRDFEHLTGAVLAGLMYLSPVLYPTSQLSPMIRQFMYFNPMSSVVEAFRYCLTETGTIFVPGIVYAVIFTVVVTISGLILFSRTEKSFIDIV